MQDNNNVSPPSTLRTSLQEDHISTGSNWQFKWVQQDKMGTSTYQNYYNYDTTARAGTIVATHQSRGANALLPWSEVAYQQYKAFPGAVLAQLKYIYRATISTVSTVDIMQQAVETGQYVNEDCADGNTWFRFPAGDSPSEAFFALLGSKNGRGVAHMLIDHCAALGKKSIQEIQVNLAMNSMKFVLTT